MEHDVVCGMQVDPANATGSSDVQGQDLLLLLQRLSGQVRCEPGPVREITLGPAVGVADRPRVSEDLLRLGEIGRQ